MKTKSLLELLAVFVFLAVGCGDGGPTRPTTTTTTAPPQPVVENFTLDAPDGEIAYSSPLANLTNGQSFEVRFKPWEINEGPSEYAYVVEFWLDRGPPQDGIALGFEWFPNSRWGVYYYTPEEVWIELPRRVLINLGGKYHTVRIRKMAASSEWFFDDESVLVLNDTQERRMVYTRVVGTRTEFEYERTSSASSQNLLAESPGMRLLLCGDCKAQ